MNVSVELVVMYCPAQTLLSAEYFKNDFEVLLFKRIEEPYCYHYEIPNTQVTDAETLDTACMRAGRLFGDLPLDNFIFVGPYDSIQRRSERTISMCHIALLTQKITPEVNDELHGSAKWSSLDKLGKLELAFDYKEMIQDAYQTLCQMPPI